MGPKINPASGKQGRTVKVEVSETLTPSYKPPGKLNGGQHPKDGNGKKIPKSKMVTMSLNQIKRRFAEAPGNPNPESGTYAITVPERQIRMKLPEHERHEAILAKGSAPLSLLEWTKVWIKLDMFHAQQRVKVCIAGTMLFLLLVLPLLPLILRLVYLLHLLLDLLLLLQMCSSTCTVLTRLH